MRGFSIHQNIYRKKFQEVGVGEQRTELQAVHSNRFKNAQYIGQYSHEKNNLAFTLVDIANHWRFLYEVTKIMASGPITSWQKDGETMEIVTDFILRGSKITADDDCSHEIKR